MPTIIASCISASVAILICIINQHFTMKQIAEANRIKALEDSKKHEESIGLITYKIDTLSERVNKHNNLIERTYQLEKETEVLKEMVKVANHRIEDLENI